jgi:hypothetical protein
MENYSKISSPFVSQLQANHLCQGTSNDCGPFCTAMILNTLKKGQYNGTDIGLELGKIVRRGIFPLVRRIPHWATFPWGVADYIHQTGPKTHWRIFDDEKRLWSSVQGSRFNIIIIGNWKPLWAHYMIVSNYDPQKGWGFINPATFDSNIFWMSPEEFRKKWSRMARMSIEVIP